MGGNRGLSNVTIVGIGSSGLKVLECGNQNYNVFDNAKNEMIAFRKRIKTDTKGRNSEIIIT